MKIEKIKTQKYKLLKLNIIKSKILKKDHCLNSVTIEDIEFRLKKALHIIYLYHICKKRILFVGNPLNINKELTQLLKSTKHVFVPMSAWIAGAITNQNSSFKSIFKQENNINKISQQLLNLKKKSDLVVIMDQKLNQIALTESYNSRLPTISFNSNLNLFDSLTSYKIPGNFLKVKNKINNNFIYSILTAILKKAHIIKHNLKKSFTELNTLLIIKKGKKKFFDRKRKLYNAVPKKKKI